ncbi:ankyrin repeat-containing protein [Colletotrichum asianum]
MSELDRNLYTVAWIAPLYIEAKAALLMLDQKHRGQFAVSRGDDYVFHAGSMCGHNIVIATLPAGQEYGTGSAAALASQALLPGCQIFLVGHDEISGLEMCWLLYLKAKPLVW